MYFLRSGFNAVGSSLSLEPAAVIAVCHGLNANSQAVGRAPTQPLNLISEEQELGRTLSLASDDLL